MFREQVPIGIGVAMAIESAAFVIGSLSHVPLKIGPIDEPQIVPAAIVEAICAGALAVGAAGVLRRSDRAWAFAFGGQVVAALGVILGIAALAAGRGPRTTLNDAFHATVLACLAAGILLLVDHRTTWRTR